MWQASGAWQEEAFHSSTKLSPAQRGEKSMDIKDKHHEEDLILISKPSLY